MAARIRVYKDGRGGAKGMGITLHHAGIMQHVVMHLYTAEQCWQHCHTEPSTRGSMTLPEGIMFMVASLYLPHMLQEQNRLARQAAAEHKAASASAAQQGKQVAKQAPHGQGSAPCKPSRVHFSPAGSDQPAGQGSQPMSLASASLNPATAQLNPGPSQLNPGPFPLNPGPSQQALMHQNAAAQQVTQAMLNAPVHSSVRPHGAHLSSGDMHGGMDGREAAAGDFVGRAHQVTPHGPGQPHMQHMNSLDQESGQQLLQMSTQAFSSLMQPVQCLGHEQASSQTQASGRTNSTSTNSNVQSFSHAGIQQDEVCQSQSRQHQAVQRQPNSPLPQQGSSLESMRQHADLQPDSAVASGCAIQTLQAGVACKSRKRAAAAEDCPHKRFKLAEAPVVITINATACAANLADDVVMTDASAEASPRRRSVRARRTSAKLATVTKLAAHDHDHRQP